MKIFQSRAAVVCLGLAALIVVFVGNVALSLKVDYLRSHPTSFRFWHYPLTEQVREVMIDLFPDGTPKSYVDRVLVEGGGATVREDNALDNVYIYREPWLPWYYKKPPNHLFIFDPDLRVINFNPRGGTEVYKGKMTHQHLIDEWTRQERLKHQQKENSNDQRP